eukprot:GHUV01002873.1.p2 GENE.GHUV01002873.1~~GHUV01002873.1.p2  ORF type:complete len:210 (-),score=56.15 GHUV01002873.1:2938-3567(-)
MSLKCANQLHASSFTAWQSCSSPVALAAHALRQHQSVRRSSFICSNNRSDVSGSREFADASGPRNTSSSSSSGQQKSAWGSSWGRKASGQSGKPLSYFDRTTADSRLAGGSDQSSSGSAGSKAASTAQLDPQLEASIRQNVDRAAETLQEIITEVLNEMLVEEASSYVMDEQGPSLQINQVSRGPHSPDVPCAQGVQIATAVAELFICC